MSDNPRQFLFWCWFYMIVGVHTRSTLILISYHIIHILILLIIIQMVIVQMSDVSYLFNVILMPLKAWWVNLAYDCHLITASVLRLNHRPEGRCLARLLDHLAQLRFLCTLWTLMSFFDRIPFHMDLSRTRIFDLHRRVTGWIHLEIVWAWFLYLTL